MARAVWTWTVAAALLLPAGWMVAGAGAHSPKLRSEHSVPATTAPAVVTITEQGKLFHRPECRFIHGPARSEAGDRAIAEGYTACTRCMKH
jgi:hypothetical protein